MISAYAAKLGVTIRESSLEIQKKNALLLETYNKTLAIFWIQNRLEMVWFFVKIFLLAIISIKVILKMSFFLFINANVKFAKLENIS